MQVRIKAEHYICLVTAKTKKLFEIIRIASQKIIFPSPKLGGGILILTAVLI